MLSTPFVIIFIAIYTIYAAAQNRRLSKINRQLAILLQMKQYEIDNDNNNHYPGM